MWRDPGSSLGHLSHRTRHWTAISSHSTSWRDVFLVCDGLKGQPEVVANSPPLRGGLSAAGGRPSYAFVPYHGR